MTGQAGITVTRQRDWRSLKLFSRLSRLGRAVFKFFTLDRPLILKSRPPRFDSLPLQEISVKPGRKSFNAVLIHGDRLQI